MDNAKVHIPTKVKQAMEALQKRGFYLFYLPLIHHTERLWKEFKARRLSPEDYLSNDQLLYSIN